MNFFSKNMNKMYYLKKRSYSDIKETIKRKNKKLKKIKIVSIIAAYNEEDIIGHVLDDYISKSIKVYFIDHHSTDNTLEQAKKFKGRGVIGIETFPEESGYPSNLKDTYAWRYILKRKEELHKKLRADWYLHMDADEIVESPWPNKTFLQALRLVDGLGYNCINFELFNFRPIVGSYNGINNPQDFFKYWEPDYYSEPQVKCWKNNGQKIDLVSSGGHIAQFEGQKVFPIKFVMKHYPIRSSKHGSKKIFSDRLPRYDKEERSMHWHTQYDKYNKKDIRFDKKKLLYYDENFVRQIYLPLISCLSIMEDKNRIIDASEHHIQGLNKQIKSIYASPTWKIGRFATAPWRLLRNFLKNTKSGIKI